MIKFSLKVPKVNENWWGSSKRELLQIVEEYNRENWSSQTDPSTGNGWAPRKSGGGWPLLNKTGQMFGSTSFGTAGTMIFTAKVGVNYGGFHQEGTSKMVERPWLGIGPQITPRMADVISKHIFKGAISL